MAKARGFWCRSRDTQRFLFRRLFRVSTGYPGLSSPSKNVLRRVGIGVARMTALDAFERRLGDAIVGANVTALVAGTGRVARIDEQQRATEPIQFVSDLPSQFAPALIQYASVEPRLRRYVPARFCGGARRARGHVRDSEVFHYDNRVVLADRRAGFVYLILADTRYPGMDRGDSSLSFPPIRGELHLAGKSPLENRKLPLELLKGICAIAERPVRQSRKTRDSNVDADSRSGVLVDWFGDFSFGLKRDIPLSGFQANCHVLDFACDLSLRGAFADPKRYPSDLRQKDAVVLDFEALRKANALREAFLLEGRHLGRELWIERALVGSGKVAQGLLQRLRVDAAQEVMPSLECLESFAKHGVANLERVAHLVPRFVLGEDRVPNESRAADKLTQQRCFGWTRLQSKSVPLKPNHFVRRFAYKRKAISMTAVFVTPCLRDSSSMIRSASSLRRTPIAAFMRIPIVIRQGAAFRLRRAAYIPRHKCRGFTPLLVSITNSRHTRLLLIWV
jgi:hypothetical protein